MSSSGSPQQQEQQRDRYPRAGSHLVAGSRLMPKWNDRSGVSMHGVGRVNLLPPNTRQEDPPKGPLFARGAEPYNLHPLVFKQVSECEYFKCLYPLKTVARVVAVVEEKVRYVEPFAETAARRPSSAFCLLVKLFTLQLTELQVHSLLDHASAYVRALGALYVRFGVPEQTERALWRWLGPLTDDPARFVPDRLRRLEWSFGSFVRRLLVESSFFSTQLPALKLAELRALKVRVFLTEEAVARALSCDAQLLVPGARVRAIFDDDDDDDEQDESSLPVWLDAVVVSRGSGDDAIRVKFANDHVRLLKLGEVLPLLPSKRRRTNGNHHRRSHTKRRRSSHSSRRHRDSRYDDDDDDSDHERRRHRRSHHHHHRRRRRRDDSPDSSSSSEDDDLPRHGESVLRGRDIMAEILRRERQSAVLEARPSKQPHVLGYNTALIKPPT